MKFLIRNVLPGMLTLGLLAFAYSTDSNSLEARSDEGRLVEPRPSEEAVFALVWGANGHRITAEIAQRYLTEATRTALEALIGDTSLAQVSTWADGIRSNPAWRYAARWHYITIDDSLARYPTGQERYEAATEQSQGNVIEAIKYFEGVLKQPGDRATRAIALKFLVHFIGDLHQPLHVGRGADRGGNSIRVRWFGESRNLHSVWDGGIIASENLSFSEFVDFIDHVPEDTLAAWQASTCIDWMNESFALRDQVYDFGNQSEQADQEGGPNLGYAYVYDTMPTLMQRLAQGGIRLAGLLNARFDENPQGATCDLPFIKDTVRLKGE